MADGEPCWEVKISLPPAYPERDLDYPSIWVATASAAWKQAAFIFDSNRVVVAEWASGTNTNAPQGGNFANDVVQFGGPLSLPPQQNGQEFYVRLASMAPGEVMWSCDALSWTLGWPGYASFTQYVAIIGGEDQPENKRNDNWVYQNCTLSVTYAPITDTKCQVTPTITGWNSRPHNAASPFDM
jgi:hypothetical protein